MTKSKPRHSKYSFQLVREPGRFQSAKYFQKKLSTDSPTEFTAEEIAALPLWGLQLNVAIISRVYLVRGLRDDGQWEVLSKWAKEKVRLDSLVDSRGGDSGKKRSGRKKGSGVDVLIAHLREIEEVADYDVIVWMLKTCSIPRIRRVVDTWGPVDGREKARNAAARGTKVHAEDCPYCRNGLPKELAEAVARLKRH